jgi:hypothetical protein
VIFKKGDRVEVYTAIRPAVYDLRIGTVIYTTAPGPEGRVEVRLDAPANGGRVSVRPDKKNVRKLSLLELVARAASDE